MDNTTIFMRHLRITAMAIISLCITFAFGITTMGTLVVYGCMIHMYCTTLKAGRALVPKRIAMQCIGIPIVLVLQILLSQIPGLPLLARHCIVFAISIPTIYGINVKFGFGFAEVSNLVIVSLISTTFDGNPWYFAWRLLFTTLGVVISYLTYRYVWPLRHDRAYEARYAAMRPVLEAAAEQFLANGGDGAGFAACRKALAEVGKHLDIVCEDVDIKSQYKAYRGKTEALAWEQDTAMRLLELMESYAAGQGKLSGDCRAYIMECARGYWNQYLSLSRGLHTGEPGGAPAADWDQGSLAGIGSDADFQMVAKLNALRGRLADYRDLAADAAQPAAAV